MQETRNFVRISALFEKMENFENVAEFLLLKPLFYKF